MLDSLWPPSASIEALRQRAAYINSIRQFFCSRAYLEVDTPSMAHHGGTDVYLSNIQASFRQKPYPLQTSPEYHMKRLLAAGSGPIFQLAKVFRDDEVGRWHNPEFTLLEWYKPGVDHHGLMDEVNLFLQRVIDAKPMIRKTYKDAFLEACDVDPFTASIKDLQSVLAKHDLEGVLASDETDKDQYLFLLMSHVVEPFLSLSAAPVAVYHFPASQAALAQVQGEVAERFEIYYRGVELANGFHELSDAKLQRSRFEMDLATRAKLGLPLPAIDSWLINALEAGLPPCSGVALGVDRLIALAVGAESLAQVMAFEWGRA